MLHYLIKITDNTLPVLVVISLLFLLATQVSRKGERGFLLCGTSLGVLVALVYAILKRNTGFAVREYYDLGVILPSLVLQLAMLFAMWWIFAEGREAGKCARLLIALLLATLIACCMPNIMLYPFEFAVGMESVFNTEYLFRVTGYTLGLLVMFLLGLGIFNLAARLPRRVLLAVFLVALLTLFAKETLEVARILVARNMVPRRPWLMSLVIFILTHVNWFSFALMGVTGLLTAIVTLRVRFAPIVGGNPAIRRKQRASHRSVYRYGTCIALCLIFSTLTVTVLRDYANKEVEISPPQETLAVDGKILIPIETVNDGNLYRFQYRTPSGVSIRYIVIKKSETAYGVGLDACDICGPSGYYQRKDQVVCKLCDVVMNISTIGFPGGCNPVPLRFGISQGNMVILAADLLAEEQRFR